MNDHIFPDVFVNLEIPPFVGDVLPCGKIVCISADGTPYYPRRHLCFREGCDKIVESPCPACMFCSEECFHETGQSEQWSNNATIFMKSPRLITVTSDPIERDPPVFPKKETKRKPMTEKQKAKKKESNRKHYEQIVANGKVQIYRQKFIQKRREENQAKKEVVGKPVEATGFPP